MTRRCTLTAQSACVCSDAQPALSGSSHSPERRRRRIGHLHGLVEFCLLSVLPFARTKAPPVDIYAGEGYTKSCCTFNRDAHLKMSNWHQSVKDGSGIGSDTDIPAGNCDICPGYTCRAKLPAYSGMYCITPEVFLADSWSPQGACEPYFGKPWPLSAATPVAEDRSIRGCAPGDSLAPSQAPPVDIYAGEGYTNSCCTFNRDAHLKMSNWHQSVKDGSGIGSDTDIPAGNCDICPGYTCRAKLPAYKGMYCITPEVFLADSWSPQDACEPYFGKPWPLSAATPVAEDPSTRGCVPSASASPLPPPPLVPLPPLSPSPLTSPPPLAPPLVPLPPPSPSPLTSPPPPVPLASTLPPRPSSSTPLSTQPPSGTDPKGIQNPIDDPINSEVPLYKEEWLWASVSAVGTLVAAIVGYLVYRHQVRQDTNKAGATIEPGKGLKPPNKAGSTIEPEIGWKSGITRLSADYPIGAL